MTKLQREQLTLETKVIYQTWGEKTIEEINSSPFIDWSRKYKTQLEDTGTTLSSLLHKSE